METLFGLLFVIGLMGTALWVVYRYVIPRLAKRDQDHSHFKRSHHDSGGSDEPGTGHSRSHDSEHDGMDDADE